MNKILETAMEALGFYSDTQKERLKQAMGRYSSYSDFIAGVFNGDEFGEFSIGEVERIKNLTENQWRSYNEAGDDETDYDDITLIELA